MPSSLRYAENLAKKVRFSDDNLMSSSGEEVSIADQLKTQFYLNGIKINKELTPNLNQTIERVCNKFHIPSSHIEAFVYSCPQVQATCYSGSTVECVIRLTSSLIELLDEKELDFVIGHELGHFILRHSLARMENDTESIEYFMQQRAQEISADRLGLIACGSLDVAIKALVKVASGLRDHNLRLDVGAFISQLQKVSNQGGAMATHPAITVRSRALLWFSLADRALRFDSSVTSEHLQQIDKKIQKDFDKYVDGETNKILNSEKANLYLWMTVYKIVEDGVFNKSEQEYFINTFGRDKFDKLINYLDGIGSDEIVDCVKGKVNIAESKIMSMMPISFNKIFNDIKISVDNESGGKCEFL